jgi:hypothetical protein
LSFNHLTHVAEGVFAGAPVLAHIDLSHNKIRCIDKEAFVGLKHIDVM